MVMERPTMRKPAMLGADVVPGLALQCSMSCSQGMIQQGGFKLISFVTMKCWIRSFDSPTIRTDWVIGSLIRSFDRLLMMMENDGY